MRLRNIGRLRAGGSAAFSPSQISFTSGLWLDPSDISTGYQDSAGTTPQTASGQPTGKRLDKSGNGLHVLQATGTSRPEYDLISGIASDFFDGSNDGYSTATFTAGTLGSNMDLFIAIKRDSTSQMVVVSQTPSDGTKFFVWQAAGGGSAINGVGTVWSVFVDGNQVGSTNAVTRDQLNTAMTANVYHVLEIRNLDLSAWTQFTASLYSSFMLNADIAQVVLCPAQTTAVRSQLRTYVGAKAGLTL